MAWRSGPGGAEARTNSAMMTLAVMFAKRHTSAGTDARAWSVRRASHTAAQVHGARWRGYGGGCRRGVGTHVGAAARRGRFPDKGEHLGKHIQCPRARDRGNNNDSAHHWEATLWRAHCEALESADVGRFRIAKFRRFRWRVDRSLGHSLQTATRAGELAAALRASAGQASGAAVH